MLTRIIARDFRNFEQLDIVVPSRGLVVVGDNGHGKTNLLEAVGFLSCLRSIRGARDADMIRFGAQALHVRAQLAAPATTSSVSVGYERSTKRKKATLDGVELPRLTSALGALPSVCFSPADVLLVTGSPSERRRYLDVALALSSRAYLHALQQYRAALARRNALLRQAQRDGARTTMSTGHALTDQVSVWEPALAEHGAVVTAMRLTYVRGHAERFSQLAAAIGERLPVTMRYASASASGSIANADVATLHDTLAAAFVQQRAQEMRRGMTLVGPHRDELQLLLGGRELRTFGSAGQQRSAAIALRLLELATLRESMGATPLLLLDDPFAELDLGRAARVLSLLEDTGVDQVLLAVPREEDIPAAFTGLIRVRMRDGRVETGDGERTHE